MAKSSSFTCVIVRTLGIKSLPKFILISNINLHQAATIQFGSGTSMFYLQAIKPMTKVCVESYADRFYQKYN